ncbi:MAG: exodeoxyribonuclease V subunit beta [bacterium]|nr:exodeoxyribonuclease V subunit beta [bacterium]
MSQVFDLQATPIEDGVTVVEASAGTGKTYCLTGLVLRLLLERRVRDVSELLVVTFTNAATQELVERVRGALREASELLAGEGSTDDPFLLHLAETHRGDNESARVLREALVAFDDLTVSTIHGFCRQVLEENAFETGVPFETELLENDAPLLLDAARDVWRRRLYGASALVSALAVEQGWTPETFLADYRTWRRHPHTEILPEPSSLEAATAELDRARDQVCEVWDTAALVKLLDRRRFRAGSYFAGVALEERLRDGEAFCHDSPAAGLRTVLELSASRLGKSLFKRDQVGVLTQPILAECTAFAAAADTLRHALRCRFIKDVDVLFDLEKRDRRALSYDDLLRRLRDALADPMRGPSLARAVRQRFRAALIDEFQDTDLIQYDIFRRLFRRGPLFLIGDPKQAIYRFRGADVFAYLAARGNADRAYTLERNWRTEEPLVKAVNAVFTRPRRPFVFERIAFTPAEAAPADDGGGALAGDDRPPLQWIWLPRQKNRDAARAAIEGAVAAEIARLLGGSACLDGRPLEPGDIAVLVRTNEQAQAIQNVLRAAGVPSVIGRAGDIFRTQEMSELALMLHAVADPGHRMRLRGAWATRLWGDDARALRRLDRDDEAWERRLERFDAYRDDWRRRGFMPMIQRLIADRGMRQRLLALDAGERRLTNLIQSVELLHRAERERQLSPAALLTWLAAEIDRERPDSEETELRLESDAPAVQVSTVHRSKGLEYEIVFCPFLWEARPVDQPPVQAHVGPERLVFDCGSKRLAEHLSRAEAERLAEDLRLTYVALTRARRRCYVVWADLQGKDGSASSALGYLLHQATTADSAVSDPAERVFDAESAGEWVDRALAQVRGSRQGWYRNVEELVAGHRRVMELRATETVAAASIRPAEEAGGPDLRPRVLDRPLPRAWSFESFSSLSRGADSELPDHRDPATPPVPQAPTVADAAADAPDVGILAFAKGRRAGVCLHQVLESCDFQDPLGDDAESRVVEALRRHGLDDPVAHAASDRYDPAEAVLELLGRLASAPLPGTGFALAEVPLRHTLVEWKFTTPLASIAPRRLAGVFSTHGRGSARDEYPARLETLNASRVRGYLTGFVDLILTHGERWYLIDWKSNHLGPGVTDYGPGALWRAMRDHHYVLQYHLYVFALHRYLRQRLPGYRYEKHIGGAFYLFLRGLDPADEAAGWFVDRPPYPLIEALDALIEGRSAA